MNFLSAIKHAAIGYGIRRRAWVPVAILSLGNDAELYWLERHRGGKEGRHNPSDTHAKLLGPDKSYDITEEDIKATDWETI